MHYLYDGRVAATCVIQFIVFGLHPPPALGYSSLPQPQKSSVRSATTAIEGLGTRQRTPPPASRRGFFAATLVPSAAILSVLLPATTAGAFDNRLDDKYATAPATTGAQPKDLGVSTRRSRTAGSYTGLKACGNSPNCLASSNPVADLPVRTIPGWSGGSIRDVRKVIDTYQVGQNDIDGGGYQVMEYDEQNQYLYVQFQSYKAGYIDDFECWYNPTSGKFDVRSASRVGYSDLGVNNLRLKYIAQRLEKEFKWTFDKKSM